MLCSTTEMMIKMISTLLKKFLLCSQISQFYKYMYEMFTNVKIISIFTANSQIRCIISFISSAQHSVQNDVEGITSSLAKLNATLKSSVCNFCEYVFQNPREEK